MEVLVFVLAMVVVGIYLAFALFEVPPFHVGVLYKQLGFGGASRDPVAFLGEPGYQPQLKMPSTIRHAVPLIYVRTHHPWPHVEPDKIGYVIANIGKPLPPGRKYGKYKEQFELFTNTTAFASEGRKGLQQKVLPPGFLGPIHPVAFTVVTKSRVFGIMTDPKLAEKQAKGELSYTDFGFNADDFELLTIPPKKMGLVTCMDGPPLPPDAVACRIGGFEDMRTKENELLRTHGINREDPFATRQDKEHDLGNDLFEHILRSNNNLHENFQNLEKFFDLGGTMGPQFYPIGEGKYAFHRRIISVEVVGLVEVMPGEVRAIRAGLGLPRKDITDRKFVYGGIVQPGYMGTWCVTLRQGMYLLHDRILELHKAQTNVLTLFWNPKTSAHKLDENLTSIKAYSRDGVEMSFDIDALVVIREEAVPLMIASFGGMEGFVDFMGAQMEGFTTRAINEREADEIIDNLKDVRIKLRDQMTEGLKKFNIDIQDIIIQEARGSNEYMKVREAKAIAIANKAAFIAGKEAEMARKEMEAAKALANRQKDIVTAQTDIEIQEHSAQALEKKADGVAAYRKKVLDAMVKALDKENAMVVEVIEKLVESKQPIVPEAYMGSGNGASPLALFLPVIRDLAKSMKEGNAPGIPVKTNTPNPKDEDGRPSDRDA